MHQRGQQRQLTFTPSRPLLIVAGLLGVVASASIGCSDDDTTNMNVGGSAGSAGSAGRGGSAGSTAGTGGTGGGASYDRQAIATAICAKMELAAAAANAANVVDAGAPLDGGSDAAAAPSCSPPPDCVNLYAGSDGPLALADAFPAECTDEVLDFYQCLGNADANSFACVGGFVDVAYGANACPTEEAAFFAIDGTNCPAD